MFLIRLDDSCWYTIKIYLNMLRSLSLLTNFIEGYPHTRCKEYEPAAQTFPDICEWNILHNYWHAQIIV